MGTDLPRQYLARSGGDSPGPPRTQHLEAQRQQLAEVKVKYIVINHPSGRLFEWSADDGLRDEYTRIYPVVYDGPDLTVLRVKPKT